MKPGAITLPATFSVRFAGSVMHLSILTTRPLDMAKSQRCLGLLLPSTRMPSLMRRSARMGYPTNGSQELDRSLFNRTSRE